MPSSWYNGGKHQTRRAGSVVIEQVTPLLQGAVNPARLGMCHRVTYSVHFMKEMAWK